MTQVACRRNVVEASTGTRWKVHPVRTANGLVARSVPSSRATFAAGSGKSFANKRFRHAIEVVGTAIMMAGFLIMAVLG